jgi:ribonuclease Y
MEIVLAAVVAATVSAAVVMLSVRRLRPVGVAVPERAPVPIDTAVGSERAADDGGELDVRRAEIARIEERLLSKQEALDVRLAELSRKERSLEDRTRNLDREADKLKASKQEHVRELERVAGLSAGQARQILLKELEDALRHDSARLIRQVEEEAKR